MLFSFDFHYILYIYTSLHIIKIYFNRLPQLETLNVFYAALSQENLSDLMHEFSAELIFVLIIHLTFKLCKVPIKI